VPKSAGPLGPGRPSRRSAASQPSKTRRSSEIRIGLPANAERQEYGELPYPVGPSGNTCQSRCPAATRKSMNSYAAGPKSPTPPDEGNEVTCNKTPDIRSWFIRGPSAVSALEMQLRVILP